MNEPITNHDYIELKNFSSPKRLIPLNIILQKGATSKKDVNQSQH